MRATSTANALMLDNQAVAAFVGEIASMLANVATTAVYATDGATVWEQQLQADAPAAIECAPPAITDLKEPVKRALGRGHFAYDFPLCSDSAPGYTFTCVIYSLDPPSLAAVNLCISPMLKCLTRQIDVDTVLTAPAVKSRVIDPDEVLSRQLDDIGSSAANVESLQRTVDACRATHSMACIAIVLPARKVATYSAGDGFRGKSLRDLAARLMPGLQKNRRVMSVRITLPDGSKSRVVCAPVLGRQNAINGMVFVVDAELKPAYSTVVRHIAGKIAAAEHTMAIDSALLNRVELVSLMQTTLAQQPTLTHSFIYFDIDRMHTVNDAFGYCGGDRALASFERILRDSAGANDSLAHLGGDRYALFLPGASGDTAMAKGEQVLRLLSEESIDDDAKSIRLSASAGIVDTEAAKKGAEDLLILAEVAARGAQDRGGNQCALFQDIDSSIIQRRSDVDKVGFLQMALIENRFELYAQHIEAINADSTRKFELLARLDDGINGNSSPAQFLSAAERYQLMAALDRWVINSALSSIAGADNTLEVSLTTFCINVSAQSLQDDSFIDFIESRIAETGLPPDILCFELTETSLVRYIDRAQRFVHRLQRLGCQVALDDFGTGYSSFAYLKTLPMNYLKIDGTFVRDVLESNLSKTIVSAVTDIATVI
ncbi:MAG: bifunctional diguanylate cyclase/phosphodiesterase, partial [Gammaproteobacteria bacterium]|nr:bifunctional diguanylate cyclase/phosphodiesterase [Gammaproteobacteria bacterium]